MVVVQPEKRYANLRVLWDTRWTPNDEAFRDLLWMAIREAGSRKQFALIVGVKPRHLRRILNGEMKAVSYMLTDRMLIRSNVGYSIGTLPWLTTEELQEQGIWKPPFGESAS
jgi:hypothetical protein